MKYPRTLHLPFSPGTTSDDRIAVNINTILNIPVVITEKLDGENTGITRNGVYARSHSDFTTSPWSREVRNLQKIISRDLEDETYFFGENMEGIHSISYSQLKSYFYLFGIRKLHFWEPWKVIEEYSYLLDIPTVPVLFKGVLESESHLKTLIKGFLEEGSRLGGKIEGIVVRDENGFEDSEFPNKVFKWVRKNHVQTDEHWTRNWKRALLYDAHNKQVK